MAFNINSVQLSETTVLHLDHPKLGLMYADEAQTQPLTIEVWGRSSKVFRNYMASQLRKNAQKSGKQKSPSADELLQSNAEFYATLTKKVSNFDLDGAALDNFDTIKELYANPALDWITTQVGEKFGEVESFLGN